MWCNSTCDSSQWYQIRPNQICLTDCKIPWAFTALLKGFLKSFKNGRYYFNLCLHSFSTNVFISMKMMPSSVFNTQEYLIPKSKKRRHLLWYLFIAQTTVFNQIFSKLDHIAFILGEKDTNIDKKWAVSTILSCQANPFLKPKMDLGVGAAIGLPQCTDLVLGPTSSNKHQSVKDP